MSTATLTESAGPRLARRNGPRQRRRWRWLWLPVLVVPAAGLYVTLGSPALHPDVKPRAARPAPPIGVSASARLAPEGEVIAVAPGSAADGGRVDRLLVAVGDRVRAGQVVAVLDTYRRRAAAVHEAKAGVVVARTKLAQVQAGPKPEDVRAQEALHRPLPGRVPGSREGSGSIIAATQEGGRLPPGIRRPDSEI